MLTKDLLRYTLDKGKIYPKRLPVSGKWLDLSASMTSIYCDAKGLQSGELDGAAIRILDGYPPFARGFKKLLDDRLVFYTEESQEEFRARLFALVTEMRGSENKCISSFRKKVATHFDLSEEEIQEQIYSDLVEHRKILESRSYSVEGLIHRFNIAQVQGLLLRSKRVAISIGDRDSLSIRKIFRAMKFHRLLGNVTHADGSIEVELGGPLSMFDSVHAYGMRLANFFPHVVSLKHWSLEAEVEVEKKISTMSLSTEDGLVSHYNRGIGYIPEEFQDFLKAFSKLQTKWSASPGSSLLDLGRQEFCFPDWEFEKGDHILKVELFHKWHRSQLLRRLKTLRKRPQDSLILAICSSLTKDKQISSFVEEKVDEKLNFFIYNRLPTVRAVLAQLEKIWPS